MQAEHDDLFDVIFAASAAAPPDPTVRRGFAAVASTGESTAWDGPGRLVFDHASLTVGLDPLPITRDHESSWLIGHADMVRIEAERILAAGVLWLDTAHARHVLASFEAGVRLRPSVSVSFGQCESVPAGTRVTVNGRSLEGPLDVVREGRLIAIGLTEFPAEKDTSLIIGDARPGAVDLIRGKLRASGELEFVALANAWRLLTTETRRQLSDVAKVAALRDGSPRHRHVPRLTAPPGCEVPPSPSPMSADAWGAFRLMLADDGLRLAYLYIHWPSLSRGDRAEVLAILREALLPGACSAYHRAESGSEVQAPS